MMYDDQCSIKSDKNFYTSCRYRHKGGDYILQYKYKAQR
jgi:hypothetical protein